MERLPSRPNRPRSSKLVDAAFAAALALSGPKGQNVDPSPAHYGEGSVGRHSDPHQPRHEGLSPLPSGRPWGRPSGSERMGGYGSSRSPDVPTTIYDDGPSRDEFIARKIDSSQDISPHTPEQVVEEGRRVGREAAELFESWNTDPAYTAEDLYSDVGMYISSRVNSYLHDKSSPEEVAQFARAATEEAYRVIESLVANLPDERASFVNRWHELTQSWVPHEHIEVSPDGVITETAIRSTLPSATDPD